MQPTLELIAAIRNEKIDMARRMTGEEKLRAGGELFDEVIQRMIAGIRMQYPGADDQQVMKHLDHRLEVARKLENRPWTPIKL